MQQYGTSFIVVASHCFTSTSVPGTSTWYQVVVKSSGTERIKTQDSLLKKRLLLVSFFFRIGVPGIRVPGTW